MFSLIFLKFLHISISRYFILLSKDDLSHFFLNAIDSHGTLHLALGLVGIHLAAASIWAVVFKFIIQSMSFRCLKCIKPVSYSYHILISNITIGE